ncbi:DUF4301 family protein [Fulvivirga sedimenti]|uniref:DUF4301 family protein n=1 Tax=Fulvivirga sedimenti TaxID=2879465 RepID=A0A9X1KY59_9BACT|nr:DUF4301 family protein [Fulvivirga sedimenti]MCA6074912.1 DUF4301 family protein [Fulvivirga sedimenti]MCA6076089.1 DUF4301 family protein [Fulvivirga sedimenti]MCA6077217.1 DUF4301 family protein [Fulvivirga sedimenti]
MFTSEDQQQIDQLGISHSDIEKQLVQFRNGFPPLPIVKNVSEGDGIHKIQESDREELIGLYETACENLQVQKFVPASGAASRMFKALYEFVADDNASLGTHKDVKAFFEGINKFAFYSDLRKVLQENGKDLDALIAGGEYKTVLNYLLDEQGLNYGFLPKGLIKFHQYDSYSRTAAEEHLVEAAQYAVSKGRQVYLHFTVSPQHTELFRAHLNEVKGAYENEFNVTYHIEYSIQDPATNTIAVGFDNEPFRDENGRLLFRPAGHGALLSNLNKLDSDIVLVKNIDNVVPDRLKADTITYKKLLGGLLIRYQRKIYSFMEALESQPDPADDFVNEVVKFLREEVFYQVAPTFNNLTNKEKRQVLIHILNRPIRICGMVVNTGATGGGPFWVRNEDGSSSLQIVETAQMNLDDPKVKTLLEDANYFNPVDVVCGLRDYKGQPFNLMKYRDDNTGIITEKSQGGKSLKALELPGLWNGSMADWLTVFMEVPAVTFNPVKSVNDLMSDEHQ